MNVSNCTGFVAFFHFFDDHADSDCDGHSTTFIAHIVHKTLMVYVELRETTIVKCKPVPLGKRWDQLKSSFSAF